MRVITFLSFILPLAYWPWFAEAAATPKWVILSLALPLLLKPAWGAGHKALLAFLCWCAVTLSWGVSIWDGVDQLWKFIIFGMAFWVGSGLADKAYERCMVAFACGIGINSVLAIMQTMGFDLLPQMASPAGLFINKNHLAEVGLLAFVAMLSLKQWWFALGAAPSFILTLERGAFVAFGLLVVVWLWGRSRALAIVALLLIVGVGVAHFHDYSPGGSFAGRLAIYPNTVAMILDNPLGVGTFWASFPEYHDAVVETPIGIYDFITRPRTAHNDILTLTAEWGIPALLLLIWLFALSLKEEKTRYVILAFIFVGLFEFPLYLPASMFVVALCAGFACRNRGGLRGGNSDRRIPLL